MNQKELVFSIVTKFFGSKFENGMSISKEEKSSIVDLIVEAHAKGEMTIESAKAQGNVKSYVIGLLNNHLRKDTRLNGGDKYTPANPGSRSGSSDPQIRAARQLLKTKEKGSAEFNKIQGFIDTKVAAIKAEKAKTVIDVESLPEELQGLV